jgi:hypothetical protein
MAMLMRRNLEPVSSGRTSKLGPFDGHRNARVRSRYSEEVHEQGFP